MCLVSQQLLHICAEIVLGNKIFQRIHHSCDDMFRTSKSFCLKILCYHLQVHLLCCYHPANQIMVNLFVKAMLLNLWYNPTLPQKTCSKPCNTWPRACFFENNYIPTVYSFISVLIFRKSPLV